MKKHSLIIMGHKTSVALEPIFWDAFCELAAEQGLSAAALAAQIDTARTPEQSLSGAIRVYIITTLRAQLADIRHQDREY